VEKFILSPALEESGRPIFRLMRVASEHPNVASLWKDSHLHSGKIQMRLSPTQKPELRAKMASRALNSGFFSWVGRENGPERR